jgi:hypothetical protein
MDSPAQSGTDAKRWWPRWLLPAALLLAMGSCDSLVEPEPTPAVETPTEVQTRAEANAPDAIRDRYVVVLEPGTWSSPLGDAFTTCTSTP